MKVFSLNTWQVPFGAAKHNKQRLKDIINYIKTEQFDIIALQEVWTNSAVQKIREELGQDYYIASSDNILYNRLGLVTLTREKGRIAAKAFVNKGTHLIERIVGKGYVYIELSDGVIVVNTHLDAYRVDVAAQQLQEIAALPGEKIILCGDLNMCYEQLHALNTEKKFFVMTQDTTPTQCSKNPYATSRFNRFTFEEKRVDYVLTRGMAFSNSIIQKPRFSDHLAVKAKIKTKE